MADRSHLATNAQPVILSMIHHTRPSERLKRMENLRAHQLVLDAPFEHTPDAVDPRVDDATRQFRSHHGLPNRLQRNGSKINHPLVLKQLANRPDGAGLAIAPG